MKQSFARFTPGVGSGRQVVGDNSSAARRTGALGLFGAVCVLSALTLGDSGQGRLGWSVTALVALALVARGIFLGRPLTVRHSAIAAMMVVAGIASHIVSLDLLGDALTAGSGAALVWTVNARRRPDDVARVWGLISATTADPLAPFVMQAGKCFLFSRDGAAGLAYRTRLGFAVVSGDPVGDETQFPQLVADFAGYCHAHGWRIVVLACSERRLPLWRDADVVGCSLRAVPIGRDVVIDVATFTMEGRRFRNLRQAVRRTHNSGITTEIVAEQDLDERQRSELAEVLRASPKGAHTDRGFSMNLDGVLQGRFPGIQLAIARDSAGRVQGFHRYATAGGGSDISLDVPWRRRDASNGVDERLCVDMIHAAKDDGAQRVSLSFAAFPEIFEEADRGRLHRIAYRLIHLLDPFIALESLYRYLRKFHADGERRYALVRLSQLVPLAVVLLSLEFLPRRRG